jgi:hypothetical protein
MTPCSADLMNMSEGQKLCIEVADSHIIKCSTKGWLKSQAFSITKFAYHDHVAVIKDSGITLHFNPHAAAVTLTPLSRGNNLVADIRVRQQQHHSEEHYAVPSAHQRDHTNNKKRLSLELLLIRLGHRKCHTLLAASKHNLWKDVTVCMPPKAGCLSCGISTIQSTACNKEQHMGSAAPGEYVFMDLLHPITTTGLTLNTSYKLYLILLDTFS